MTRVRIGGSNATRLAATLVSLTLVVAILHLAQVVLVPVALALLFTFILSPLVVRLDRWGFGRIAAVLLVVVTTGVIAAASIWLVGSQLHHLANDLPDYKENLRQKLAAIRQGSESGAVQRIRSMVEDLARHPDQSEEPAASNEVGSTPPQQPLPVRVVPEVEPSETVQTALASMVAFGPALEVLATAGMVIVLVLFMLIKHEDLRNRLVSFTSEGSLSTTTKALDDAGQRISRYLLMQLIINGSFGIAVGIGLVVLGVPYALLWGLSAAVLRYIPYVGAWVAALLPLLVSVITFPTWTQPLIVLCLFLILELGSNNLMEPWLYGQGVGLSAVALLVSAAFWTWVWGPVGLVLATPLTVCLVVIGKYVPGLGFLDRLLSDRPVLPPHMALLQRLLAKDYTEAAEIVHEYIKEQPPDRVYDEVLVPALTLARKDRRRGSMTAGQETLILQATRSILMELGQARRKNTDSSALPDKAGELVPAAHSDTMDRLAGAGLAKQGLAQESPQPVTPTKQGGHGCSASPLRVLGCAAHQEAEELTLLMLDQLVGPAGLELKTISTRTLPSEIVDKVSRDEPSVVVIADLPPGGLAQAQYLCKLLRKRFPRLGIVVGCWRYRGNLDRVIMKFRKAGAHYITTTLLGARDHVTALARQPARPSASEESQVVAPGVSVGKGAA